MSQNKYTAKEIIAIAFFFLWLIAMLYILYWKIKILIN